MGDKGFLSQFADTLSPLLYSFTNLVSGKNNDRWGGVWRPWANAAGNVLDAFLPGDVIPDLLEDSQGRDYRGSYSDILKNMGASEGWQKWGGGAADILLDPTNLLGVGLVGKGAQLAGRLGKVGRITDKMGNIVPLADTFAGRADQGANALLKIGLPFTGKEATLIEGKPWWEFLDRVGARMRKTPDEVLMEGPKSGIDSLIDAFASGVYQPIQKAFFSPSGTGNKGLDEYVKTLNREKAAAQVEAKNVLMDLIPQLSKKGDVASMIERGELPEVNAVIDNWLRRRQLEGVNVSELQDDSLKYFMRQLSDPAARMAKESPEQFAKLRMLHSAALGKPHTPEELNALMNLGEIRPKQYGAGMSADVARRYGNKTTKEINDAARAVELGGKKINFDFLETNPIRSTGGYLEKSADSLAKAKALKQFLPQLVQDAGTRRVEDVITELGLVPEVAQELGVAGKFVPEDIYRFFTSPEKTSKIPPWLRSLTGAVKTGLTTLNPAFHGRNFSGGASMNALESGGGIGDYLASFGRSGKLSKDLLAGTLDPETAKLLEYGRMKGYAPEMQFGPAQQALEKGGPKALAEQVAKEQKMSPLRKVVNAADLTRIVRGDQSYAPMRAGQKLGAGVETVNRLSAARDVLNQMKKSGLYDNLPEEELFKAAWDAAAKTQIDYVSGFSPADRVMREIFPFWSWSKTMLPRMAKYAVTDPSKIAAPVKLPTAFGGRDDRAKPEWLRDQISIPIGDQSYLISLGLPQEEILKLGDMGKSVLTMLNPAARVPLEVASDTNLYKQRKLSTDTVGSPFFSAPIIRELIGGTKWTDDKGKTHYGVENPMYKYAVENTPGLGTLARLFSRSFDERKGAVENLLNAFTGLKTAKVDEEGERIQSNWKDIEKIVNLLSAQGKAREFKTPYLTTSGKMDPNAAKLMKVVQLQKEARDNPAKAEEARRVVSEILAALGV